MAKLYKYIIYSGVLAFIFMVVTFIAVISGLDFRIHKIAGILAVIFACLHTGLIIYRSFRIKKSSSPRQ